MTQYVYVVDDVQDTRISTIFLLRALGFEPWPFVEATDLLGSLAELQPGVILLRLRGQFLATQSFLAAAQDRELGWPLIVLADAIQTSEAVAAMKLGASDVLNKPLQAQELLEAIKSAGNKFTERLAAADRVRRARTRVDALSPRELEVLRALLAGYTNKRVAEICHISVRTVEMHRAHLLERLGVETVIGVVRVALEAGVEPLDEQAA
jgi:FixJ family two-component response regulator